MRRAGVPPSSSTRIPRSNPRPTFGVRGGLDDRRNSMMPLQSSVRRSTMLGNGGGGASAGRQSSMGRSSVYSAGGTSGRMKDPRPLTEKAFIQQTARELVAFIVERGYDGSQLSAKTLASLSSKEFISVFVFFLQRLDPTFQFIKRFEDELPTLLKSLGYPFSMSRSALSAMGSPHTWAALIGVLEWLMRTTKAHELIPAVELSQNDENDVQTRRIMFFDENALKAYQLWLSGVENSEECERECDELFKNESRGRAEEIEQFERKQAEYRQTVETLQNTQSPLVLCRDHVQTLKGNTNKFKQLLPSLVEHLETIAKKCEDREKENNELNETLQKIATGKAELEPILTKQENEAIDAQRIAMELEGLREGMAQSTLEVERYENELQDYVRRSSITFDRTDSTLSKHNQDLEIFPKYKECIIRESNEGEDEDLGLSSLSLSGFSESSLNEAGWREEMVLKLSSDANLTSREEIVNHDFQEITSKLETIRHIISRRSPSSNDVIHKEHDELDLSEEKRMFSRHELDVLRGMKEKKEAEIERKTTNFQQCLDERSKLILKQEEEIGQMMQQEEDLLNSEEEHFNKMISNQFDIDKDLKSFRIQSAELLMRSSTKFKQHLDSIFEDLHDWTMDIERRGESFPEVQAKILEQIEDDDFDDDDHDGENDTSAANAN